MLLTFENGQSNSTEEVVTTISGEQHNVITWTAPICNKSGDIEQVVEISTDITDIRKLQDRLTSLGLMISSVSHGIRGMLTALDGGIYKLETGIEKKNTKRIFSAFTQIKQTVNRIRKTILEILYYAKSRQFKYEKIKVSDFLNVLDDDFRATAENSDIKFEIINLMGTKHFEIDYSWMHVAISNFIENAIDACIEDKQSTRHFVRLKVCKKKFNQVEFLIKDNGLGMNREIKNKLFTLFFSSKGSKGTGLGLFISNQVISQHSGSVEIEETGLEKGTSFKINIPAKQI